MAMVRILAGPCRTQTESEQSHCNGLLAVECGIHDFGCVKSLLVVINDTNSLTLVNTTKHCFPPSEHPNKHISKFLC